MGTSHSASRIREFSSNRKGFYFSSIRKTR
nr:MAG TPA: hypothetical protein [Caudoviricetes sp.]